MSEPARAVPSTRSPSVVVAVLSSVGLVASLCMTLVIPIVPDLPLLLGTTPTTASWVITSTLLAGAVATPIAGRLGDMFGKRRVLLGAMSSLVLGAVLCATSSEVVPVLAGRVLQGVAVSSVPLGISLMRDALPPERLGSGIALMSATLGIGGGLGLPLSAVIVQVADWHALFWTAAALGSAGLALVLAVIPETPVRSGGHFDALGAIGLSIGLVCLLLTVSKGGEWGWTSATTVGLGVAAVLVLLGWGAYELRTPEPLVDLRITARPAVLLPNLISIPVGVAMFTGMVVYPQLLTAPASTGFGLGLSLLVAGLVMAPNGLVMMMMSPVTARISALAGPRTALRIGLVIIVVAYAAGSVLLSAWWQVTLVMSLVGAGVALAYGSLPALIMRAVPTEHTAAANGLNTLMRSLGTSTASAVAAVVLASSVVVTGAGASVPTPGALQATLLIAAGCGLVALVLSLLLAAPAPAATSSVTDPGHGTGWVHGRVVLPGGGPADGARVTAVTPDGRQLAVTPADAEGRFSLDVDDRPTTVVLIAGHPDATPQATRVEAGGGADGSAGTRIVLGSRS